MVPRWRRWLYPLAPALALLSAGCAAHPQSALSPAGPVARMELNLGVLSLWIMIGVFVVVAGIATFVLVRFTDRGDRGGELPNQVEGSTRLELLWTIVPILLLLVLVIPTIRDTFTLAARQPGGLQVDVVGHQFWWEFDYPTLGIKTADEMHIPTGRAVNLSITSADVIHSFWVPSLAGKQAAVPGHVNTMWLLASKSGTYPGQCAEFCGLSHSDMHFAVVAQSPAEFAAWVRSMQHPVTTPTSTLAKQGQQLFNQYGCGACHSITGTSAQGTLGPNLTGLGNRSIIAAGVLTNTPANLATWLANPPGVMPGVIMPDFHLNSAQQKALVAYLEGLH